MVALGLGALASPAVLSRRSWADAAGGVATGPLEDELIFACTGGVMQKIMEEDIIPPFAEKHGVNIIYVPSPSSQNLAKLRTQRSSPSIDVIWLAGATTFQAIDDDVLADYDPERIPNAANVYPNLATESKVLPVGQNVIGLLYNGDILSEKGFDAPTSWWDMWDPKYKQHTGMLNINSTSTIGTVSLIAKILSGDPYDFDAAFAKFAELMPNVYDFFSASGEMDALAQEGLLWVWSHAAGRAMFHRKSGFPVRFVAPKEGAVGYSSSVAVVKNGPHPNVAHAWVNYLLSTDVQEKIALKAGYAPVVPGVTIPADVKEFFPDLDTIFFPDYRKLTAVLPELVDRWNREVER
ncbi:ABC transporter substrate-binding protein [Acuticoccus mangrovi]|uniref:ABC transporter substrate-binding protein n=1 Tax=Acuticoccus mangrovi TaxID=2796142 RepID=A0A934MDT5_9HYPH|nr:ABC transporter substrate-binding protein [Acuticoccus mangrovi]MBJ3776727.1 ABC transporter substrate-binding protein [Acuticoccus mangrovi]